MPGAEGTPIRSLVAELDAVTTAEQFGQRLKELKEVNGLTFETIERRGGIPSSTASSTIGRRTLPSERFVRSYVRACGVDDDGVEAWVRTRERLLRRNKPAVQAEERVQPPAAPAEEPTDPAPSKARRSWLPRGRARRTIAISLLAGMTAAAATTTVVLVRDDRCDTWDPALMSVGTGQEGGSRECVGVTDGVGASGVFGPESTRVLELIAQENGRATAGPYVTIAFLAPLGSGQGSLTGDRSVHQLEGLLTAQRAANGRQDRPNIRLVLANMGSDESQWRHAVDHLKTMTTAPDRLVAVVGMGLSQQESIQAARTLSAADIPMVSDVITADGFGTTGATDKGEPIRGLLRVALSTTSQLVAIRDYLKRRPLGKRAVLVWTDETPQGSSDLYTSALKEAFLKQFADLLGDRDQRRQIYFDPRGNPILQDVCEREIVLYAGRQTFLPKFLQELRNRPCPDKPITVITGSDATAQPRDTPELNNPRVPTSLIYVPLADPGYLRSPENRGSPNYIEFEKRFGERFKIKDLDSGWAVMSHDALLTAITAVKKAYNQKLAFKEPDKLPDNHDVGNALGSFKGAKEPIPGASGFFTFDFTTGSRVDPGSKIVHVGPPGG
ncbi:helix-turn-helix domain-containing protein [Streptosporangium saharense]|uniref:helix-turn-helix domain-containing protein n=1 Tax=Streptosporangium saharense TaxID=1706840 RepID=UPI0033319BC1